MGQSYTGEIRMFAGNFAPVGWAFCNGQLLPISENEALFILIGTTYGGDGQETFGLPDLQGRLPVHQGQGSGLQNHVIGEKAGVETVTLSVNQMPSHTHPFLGSQALVSGTTPLNNVVGQSASFQLYIQQPPSVPLAATAVSSVGGSQPHDNIQPFLCISFIISLFGIFPSQN